MSESNDGTTASRRLRKKERTRRQLERVAYKLFLKKGFDNVSILDISEAADVVPTTFWRHFGSKEAMLFADQRSFLHLVRTNLANADPAEPVYSAAIKAMVQTSSAVDPKLDALRSKVILEDPSPSIQAAVRSFEDMALMELTAGMAERMKVDANTDPRPFMLAGAIMQAARWLREHPSGEDQRSADPNLFRTMEVMLADLSKMLQAETRSLSKTPA